ncbi:hypothetical protein P8452_31351 [Trifolium repens]|nr:hypothetical protein P8452_31351 [Trifolium repens]
MDPRISFSNDFVVSKQAIKHENIYREAPVSSDFEFSVKNYSMISADQAFFKGMLLPLSSEGSKKVTLRDELLNNDDSPKWSKSISRWKERLGLKRGASKKDKNKGDHEFVQRSVANHKGTSFGQGETTINKDIMLSQELFCEGGVSCKRK